MEGYEAECVEVFLREQEKLLGEKVFETEEEVLDFFEDCFATVLDSVDDIRAYFDDNGMDVQGMSEDEILNSAEVFELPSGKYLVVEG